MPDNTPNAPTAETEAPENQWEELSAPVVFGKTSYKMLQGTRVIKANKAALTKGKKDVVKDVIKPLLKTNGERAQFLITVLDKADEIKAGSSEELFDNLLKRRYNDASDKSIDKVTGEYNEQEWLKEMATADSAGLRTASAVRDALEPIKDELIDLLNANLKGDAEILSLASEYPTFKGKDGKVDRGAFNTILAALSLKKHQLTELLTEMEAAAEVRKTEADKAKKAKKEKEEAAKAAAAPAAPAA